MKKLVIAALAASSLAGGAVLAQSAQENSNAQQFSVPHPERGGYIYGNSGWTPPSGYVYQGTDRWGRPYRVLDEVDMTAWLGPGTAQQADR